MLVVFVNLYTFSSLYVPALMQLSTVLASPHLNLLFLLEAVIADCACTIKTQDIASNLYLSCLGQLVNMIVSRLP